MENVENLFKKMFYTGVGFAFVAKEKFEKAVQDLIKDERLSSEEGKKIMDDFVQNMDSKKEEWEKNTKEFVEKVVKKFNFATKEEVIELNKKLDEIYNLLKNQKENPQQ